MKSILVPTDFSDNARNALDYAISLAQVNQRKIILLSVYHVPSGGSGMMLNLRRKLEEDTERSMKHLMEKLNSEFSQSGNPMPEIEAVVVEGSPVDTILQAANAYEAIAIVMGTNGASGVEGRVMGSNTSKVIEKAHIPVLAVPENAVFKGFGKVVYATDAINPEDQALHRLMDLLDSFDCEYTVLHILPVKEEGNPEHLEVIRLFKENIGHDHVEVELEYSDNVVQGITKYVKDHKAPLLAMVTHQRGFFAKVFDPSLTRSVALHAEVPLLVFHAS